MFWDEVTAADRAAATSQRWGTNPSARLRRAEGERILHQPLPQMVPLLLRKAAREGVTSCTSKAEGMKTD